MHCPRGAPLTRTVPGLPLYSRRHSKTTAAGRSRLKNESLKARYLAVGRVADTDELKRSQFAMSAAQVHEQLYKKVLAKIRGYVQQRLPKPTEARKRAT